jgi:hypothetical protein
MIPDKYSRVFCSAPWRARSTTAIDIWRTLSVAVQQRPSSREEVSNRFRK